MLDNAMMRHAMALADSARGGTSPNPWVGAVVVTSAGATFDGVTQPPGGMHAEVAALAAACAAGAATEGATLWVTLEPCAHQGRTGPCCDAIVAADVARVVVGITDPDPQVAGRGIAHLRAAGIDVIEGVEADAISEQLAAYLKHRRTGRPWVTLKLAASLDGRTAAPDGSSRWITGEAARADVHRLRAQADAVVVGSGTIRQDDPALTVRHVAGRDPLRVVLGRAPLNARVHPALELSGDLGAVLDELGARGIISVLVEGGATVAHSFHDGGLVDRYVLYVAPALFGGDDAVPLFRGPGVSTIGELWRGRLISVERLGDDLRIEVAGAASDVRPLQGGAGAGINRDQAALRAGAGAERSCSPGSSRRWGGCGAGTAPGLCSRPSVCGRRSPWGHRSLTTGVV